MTRQTVPVWYWALSVALLLWSLAGVGAFGSDVSIGPERLAQLPEAQRNALSAMPAWNWLAYGVATIGALAAAISLLLRRTWAAPIYVVSLIAVAVQFSWSFAVARLHETIGPSAAIFPAVIVLIGAFSVWFSHFATKRGWLA